MINIKPEVLQALESNDTLISLLGGPKIYQMIAPEDADLPRITFFEVSNFDSDYADDKEISSEIQIQVDVWSFGSTSDIAHQVDLSMKKIGFTRSSSADLYQDELKVFHKAMRFNIKKEVI